MCETITDIGKYVQIVFSRIHWRASDADEEQADIWYSIQSASCKK